MTASLFASTRLLMARGHQQFGAGFHDAELNELRFQLLTEEFLEWLSAVVVDGQDNAVLNQIGGLIGQLELSHTPDAVEEVDGLIDIIVIAYGSLLAKIGTVATDEVMAEIARSNASKVDGSLGPIVRRDDGKILKPSGWTPPDVAGVLHALGFG